MNQKMKTALVIAFVCSLFLVAGAWAMSSANYRLDWFTPMTGGGGGPTTSTNYRANFTIGQTVVGTSNSTTYHVGLGFWYGIDAGSGSLYLPTITR